MENRTPIISHHIFAGLTYYPNKALLKIDDETRRVSGIPKSLLDGVLKYYPELVSMERLAEELWPDEPEKRTSTNFYTQLRLVRKLLGDDKQEVDRETGEKRPRIIDFISTGFIGVTCKVETHYHESSLPYRTRSLSGWTKAGISASLLAIATISFSFAFKDTVYYAQNKSQLSQLNGEFQRAATSPNGLITVYNFKYESSTSWHLIATNKQTSATSWLVTEQKPDTHNTEPNFSPSGKQLVWVRTDYKTHCEILVAEFEPDTLTFARTRKVLNCDPPMNARTPQFKNENEILVAVSDFQSPFRIIKLNLWTGEKTTITKPANENNNDYSLFYNSDNQQMAYLREADGTGAELRIYDFTHQTDSLLKKYPSALYSVAWINNRIVAQSEKGYEAISTTASITPIQFNEVESLHFPFSDGPKAVGFVKGTLFNRDIVIYHLKTPSEFSQLSTKHADYVVVGAKNNDTLIFFSLKDGKNLVSYQKGKSTKVIADLQKNGADDLAVSPNGKTIAYKLENTLIVQDLEGKTLYSEITGISGFTFSSDSQQLLISKSSPNEEPTIVSLSLNNQFQPTTITKGFLPKTTNNKLYYMRKNPADEKVWLYEHSDDEPKPIMVAPFSTDRIYSYAFDIVNNNLYYFENDALVKTDLTTQEKTIVTPVENARGVSINNAEDLFLTTKKMPVQNSLISVELVK
ncbi:PD40 domain-containing protein [Aliikangiella coralliicola]|uniref:OmpR/PhoB-type domain-containing protein n=1 Tax=Aliikangiella coralliicola TaxID=2592383 RepID=A0A545UCD9_9GAMM|nr:PD40 domain-containing protein [Aliikangiella coralliicola]TQV87127.1 hypothetical protein FLL46_15085 [Aliikangiella coralliicola]